MEDFREIVGFLIIGVGILLSVLKEKKDKKSSGNSAPAQNTPIQRKPQNQQQAPAAPKTPHSQGAIARAKQHITEASTLPFTFSKVAEQIRSKQLDNNLDSLEQSETSAYQTLPEEGARVTQDTPPMESVSDLANQEEEEFIEKLREGIILSEILQRKF